MHTLDKYIRLSNAISAAPQKSTEMCIRLSQSTVSGRDSPHQYDTGWIKLLVISVSLSSARKPASMTTISFLPNHTILYCISSFSQTKMEKLEAKMESDRSLCLCCTENRLESSSVGFPGTWLRTVSTVLK